MIRNVCLFISGCVLLYLFSGTVFASDDMKWVLMVDSHITMNPRTESTGRGFRKAMTATGFEINYSHFSLDVALQPGIKSSPESIRALQTRLDSRKYDLVVASDNDAADLFLNGGIKLPDGTPLLLEAYHGNPSRELKNKLNMTAVLAPFLSYENAKFGLQLLPGVKKIVLVADASAEGRKQCEQLAAISDDEISSKITIIDGKNHTADELFELVAALPPDTLLLFHSWTLCKGNNPTDSYTILRRIRELFSGMILSSQQMYLAMGGSDGIVTVGKEQSYLAGQVAARILNGEKAAAIPYEKNRAHMLLDYNALRTYNIPLRRVPAGTRFVNAPSNFLTRYQLELGVAAGILFILQAGIIALLLYRSHEQKKATMLFACLPLRIFIFDREERILHAHIPDPVDGMIDDSLKTLNQIAAPEAAAKIRAAVREAFNSGGKVILESEINGQFRHDEFLRLSDRNPFHTEIVVCVSTDMTALHEAHRAADRTAERFRMTLESIGDGVITTDCDENIVLLNPVAAALTGYTIEEAKGKPLEKIFDIVSYIDDRKVDSPLHKALTTGETVELTNHTDLIAQDGSRRHIADCASPIRDEAGRITGGVLVFRDVTSDYEKRDQQRMNSAILQMVEQVGRIGYFRCSNTGQILHPAPAEYWPRRNGKPVHPAEWVAPENLEELLTEWRKLLADEQDSLHLSFSGIGTPKRYFELRAVKSVNEISGRREYCGVIQDITFSRESECKAQDNFQLMKSIMDNLPGYIFVKNAGDDFRYLMCNRQFAEMIGVDADRIPGCFDKDIFPLDEASARKFREDDRALIDSGEILNIRERFVSADGQSVVVQTVKSALVQSDGTRLLIGMGVDISREFALEQRQKQTIQSLERSTRSERIVNQSLGMITVEPDFSRAIHEMLRIIGENVDADRAYIFLYTGEGRFVSNDYEWVRDGVEAQKDDLQNINMDDFPSWDGMLLEKQDLLVEDMTSPPPLLAEELGRLTSQGIKSLLVSGIWHDGGLIGFVGLDYTREQHNFDESSVHTVKNIANLFLLARERAQQLERLADSVLLQRQIVDNLSIPIAIVDADCRMQAANPSMLRLLGKTAEEIKGRFCYEMICCNHEIPEWCCLNPQSVPMAQSVYIEWEERSFLVNNQPIFNRQGQLRYGLTSFIDVTELNRQKAELQNAMEQAQAANRAKSYFLATMSHEIRTPLNAVIGFSELLQSGQVSQEEQLEYLYSINCAGSALLNLVNDVLDLSKLEAEQMNIMPGKTDMVRLLDEMISVFQLKAKQKGLALRLQSSGIQHPVYVDHLRVRQILLNLIGNAIKFTQHGEVTVGIDFICSENEPTGELILRVTDTGIGIPEEQQKKIFDPFVQADATRGNRAYEGSGLGLAISMRLVQRMGGTIELASVPGQGSTFTVKLEKIKYEENGFPVPARQKSTDEFRPERQRVLLVDDVPMNLKVLAAMLRKLNVDSISAESGALAQEILRKDQNFQFVLTDIWMPRMSGEELAQWIHDNPATAHLTVVAITADSQVPAAKCAVFHGICLKPITLDSLRKVLGHREEAC